MANHEMSMAFKTKADNANKSIQQTIENMKALGREIISVQTKLKPNGSTSYVVQYKNALDRVTETYKRLEDGTVKLAKSTSTSLKKGFDTGRLLWYYNILRGVLNRFKSIEQSAIDFNETIEKFNVSMGSSVTQASKFQNIISETFGTSRADMMNYQSNFRNVMAGLGDISSKTAEKISESLTKMSLDYSSLFNVSQDTAANKVQAALVGQIMPVRRESGYDVSKNAVNQRATELGLDRTYAQLNETEKRLIRIMLLMDQMKNTGAFQDLARTIESPSNQLKVLKNQIQEVGIWLGNVFMGTIGAILPYINGFVMALKELIKMFAIFVGYEPIAAGEGEALQIAENAAGGIGDNLGKASKKAKELKKQLQGFDELNIINTPQASSGGSGGGGGAPIGIDPAILGALGEYDSLMDGVRMKATEIRDKIMEWLGFIKKINPLTGDISWELQDGYTNFEKILDVVKQIGAGILAWKVSDKVFSFIQKLGFWENVNTGRLALGLGLTVTGIFAEYNGIKHILNGDVDMFTLLETLLGGATTSVGIVSMLRATKWGKELKLGQQLKIATGVTLAIASFTVLTEGLEKNDLTQQLLGSLGLIGSSALAGSSFGPTGIVIGIAVGIIATVVTSSFKNGKKYTDELTDSIKKSKKALDDYRDSSKRLEEEVQNKVNTGLAEIGAIEKLTTELGNLVEANGKVKAGYEDRVKFILDQVNKAFGTEYKLINGVITENGKQVESYKNVKKSIEDLIRTKKAELVMEANKELYQEAIRKETQLYQDRKKAEQEQDAAFKKVSNKLEKYGLTVDDVKNKTQKFNVVRNAISNDDWLDISEAAAEYEQSITNLNGLNEEWEKNMKTRATYEKGYEALISGNAEKIKKTQQEIVAQYKDGTASIGDQLSQRIEYAIAQRQEMEKNGKAITKQNREELRAQYKDLTNTLIDEVKQIKKLTPDQAKAWKLLAEEDAEFYRQAISKVDEDTRLVIETSSKTVDASSPEVAKRWAKLAEKSEDKFIDGISVLPEDTKVELLAMITKTTGMTPQVAKAYGDLSFSGKESFMKKLSSLPEDEKKKITEAIDKANKEKSNMRRSGEGLSKEFKSGANSQKVDMSDNINFSREEARKKVESIVRYIKGLLKTPFNLNLNAKYDGQTMATGGFPEMGEMFIAREAGPELVGKIGNRTAVANNDQIVQAVSQGVAKAVSSVMGNQGGSYQLFLDGEQITNVVQQRINRNANIYGR